MTRYRDFSRHVFTLYKEAHAKWVISDWDRKRLVESVEDTVMNAELKWPGNGTEGNESISGSEHLCQHLAHDWALSEREEVAFRRWWNYVTTSGFGPTPLHRPAKETTR